MRMSSSSTVSQVGVRNGRGPVGVPLLFVGTDPFRVDPRGPVRSAGGERTNRAVRVRQRRQICHGEYDRQMEGCIDFTINIHFKNICTSDI